jgi:hypothetical protein
MRGTCLSYFIRTQEIPENNGIKSADGSHGSESFGLVVIAGNLNARFTGENTDGKCRSVIINFLGPRLWIEQTSSMSNTRHSSVFNSPLKLPTGPLGWSRVAPDWKMHAKPHWVPH